MQESERQSVSDTASNILIQESGAMLQAIKIRFGSENNKNKVESSIEPIATTSEQVPAPASVSASEPSQKMARFWNVTIHLVREVQGFLGAIGGVFALFEMWKYLVPHEERMDAIITIRRN